MKGSRLRIVRGRFGGRYVDVNLEYEDLRPTLNRVREAVFSMIHDYAREGFGFVDLCAGTGAMGFEAASVGFEPTWLIDTHAEAVELMEKNKAALGAEVTIVRGTALRLGRLGLPQGKWLLYADPPFREQGFHSKMTKRLTITEQVEPGSIYIAETEKEINWIPEGFQLLKAKRYGRVHITLFEKLSQTP